MPIKTTGDRWNYTARGQDTEYDRIYRGEQLTHHFANMPMSESNQGYSTAQMKYPLGSFAAPRFQTGQTIHLDAMRQALVERSSRQAVADAAAANAAAAETARLDGIMRARVANPPTAAELSQWGDRGLTLAASAPGVATRNAGNSSNTNTSSGSNEDTVIDPSSTVNEFDVRAHFSGMQEAQATPGYAASHMTATQQQLAQDQRQRDDDAARRLPRGHYVPRRIDPRTSARHLKPLQPVVWNNAPPLLQPQRVFVHRPDGRVDCVVATQRR